MANRCGGVALALFGAGLLNALPVHAAGMYAADRGVRPLARGGAFVAGADDLGAIWYNPAGLADAQQGVLLDAGLTRSSTSFQRELAIRDADGVYQTVTSPTVNGSTPFLPIPTIAGAKKLGDGEWTLAGGIYAPYFSLSQYPETVDGQPSPARYALQGFGSSAVAMAGFWVAWKPPSMEWLRLGAGAQLLTGTISSDLTFSATLPDRVLTAPEDPDFDGRARLKLGPVFAPSASLGVTLIPASFLRFGFSGQLPMVINSSGTLDVRLPSSALFDGAQVEGSRVRVNMTLPGIARAGMELRPSDWARVELAYVREFWSGHDKITATPQDLRITGVVGLPESLAIPAITIPRQFQDSNSVRLGTELSFNVAGKQLDTRLGVAYETSGIPAAYVSTQSLDMDKTTATIGLGLHATRNIRIDVMYAKVFTSTLVVNPTEAAIPRVNPINGNAPFEAINGGTYSAKTDVFGLGIQYAL